MQHYIIVKFNDFAANHDELIAEITTLFKQAESLPGVYSVSVRRACILSDIRYDLMVIMDMEREALATFDASPIHREWKERFGKYLKHKVIFDCEDKI
jgi:Stress responsive A/B Barrel Domain.